MRYFFVFLQELAEDNKARRNSITDTHTLGPVSMAEVRENLVCVFPFHVEFITCKVIKIIITEMFSKSCQPSRVNCNFL